MLLHEKLDRFWHIVGRDSLFGQEVEYMYQDWLRAEPGQAKKAVYITISSYIEDKLLSNPQGKEVKEYRALRPYLTALAKWHGSDYNKWRASLGKAAKTTPGLVEAAEYIVRHFGRNNH